MRKFLLASVLLFPFLAYGQNLVGPVESNADVSGLKVTPTGGTQGTLGDALKGTIPGGTLTPGITNFQGTGTSGQYDGQISVSGGGSQVGQGVLMSTSAQQRFNTYDGTIQFSIGLQPTATEYWQAQGGTTGVGANLFATNGSPLTGNVDGNIVAQNNGNLWLGTGSGWGLKVSDPGAPGTNYLTATAGTSATNAKLSSTANTEVDGSTVVLSAGGFKQATVENLNSITSSANYVSLFGAATGVAPGIKCRGDTNTACWIRPSGTSGLTVVNDQGALLTITNSAANTIFDYPVLKTASSGVPIVLQTGNNTANIALGATGGVHNTLATTATTGHVAIPVMAGAPTGVPVGAGSGNGFIVYDSTDAKLCIYVLFVEMHSQRKL
jgi:hypothetical protein